MDDPGFFAEMTVAIWGLGLMGGSLALALNGKCKKLIGIDYDLETLSSARSRNVVDLAVSSPENVLPQADVVILATPVCTIIKMLGELPALHPGSPVVMDIGSTKVDVLNAMEKLPSRFDPIGGHPMAGNEHATLAFADKELFNCSHFALVPLGRTGQRARDFAQQLVYAAGADALWMEAGTHDNWAAATSHLPYLAACAISIATPLEAAPLVGPGFRSTTRVASKSSEIMLDILRTNRLEVIQSIGRFKNRLSEIEKLLENGEFEALETWLEDGTERHQKLVGKK